MSLKNRIIFMMTLVVTAFFGLIYTIQNHFLINNLNKIEREEITKNLKRCGETIRKEYSHIDISCYDWARWDDMYNYVLTRGEAFEKSNLNNSTMEINQLNGFFIIGNNGELIWGKSYDLKKETDISVKEFPYENWPLDHPLLQIKRSEGKLNGLFITEKGAVLVSSRPILKSNNEGPAVGTLIMFRFLQDKVIHSVEKQLNISIKLFDLTRDNIPHIKNIAERVCSKNPYLILKKKKGDLTRAYILLNDIDNKPCLLAETVMYMEITEQAYTLLRFGIFSILWGSVIILVIMSIFLQRSVINPVIKLKNHIKNIKRSNNLSLRIESGKNDEIGILAGEFNDLLYRLNKVITELQTARKDIQESENYLKNILDSIQTGVILIDKNNKCIMDVNNYVIKLINVQKDSLILTPLNTFLQRAVNLDDNRSQTNLHENIIIDSNGREIPILFSFVNIENKNKSYYILNFIDMTDYKKIEDELLKIRKLESLGILAGGIAHDFNNLLAAILGNISLAISDMDEKTGIYRFLKNAETASNKARDLSQQLLTFSKGGMPVKKPPQFRN